MEKCLAILEDGRIDKVVCRELSAHPVRSRIICKRRRCSSPFRICWACAGQRFKRFRKFDVVELTKFLRQVSASNEYCAVSPDPGLCRFHKANKHKVDRFPSVRPPSIKKHRGETTEESLPRDIFDVLETPDIGDSPFDMDDETVPDMDALDSDGRISSVLDDDDIDRLTGKDSSSLANPPAQTPVPPRSSATPVSPVPRKAVAPTPVPSSAPKTAISPPASSEDEWDRLLARLRGAGKKAHTVVVDAED